VWSPGIVTDEIVVERRLHLVDGFEPGLAALDAEVFVDPASVRAAGSESRRIAMSRAALPPF
jgi:hypothetical protein